MSENSNDKTLSDYVNKITSNEQFEDFKVLEEKGIPLLELRINRMYGHPVAEELIRQARDTSIYTKPLLNHAADMERLAREDPDAQTDPELKQGYLTAAEEDRRNAAQLHLRCVFRALESVLAEGEAKGLKEDKEIEN